MRPHLGDLITRCNSTEGTDHNIYWDAPDQVTAWIKSMDNPALRRLLCTLPPSMGRSHHLLHPFNIPGALYKGAIERWAASPSKAPTTDASPVTPGDLYHALASSLVEPPYHYLLDTIHPILVWSLDEGATAPLIKARISSALEDIRHDPRLTAQYHIPAFCFFIS